MASKKPAPRRFVNEDLSNAVFRNVNLANARIRGALLTNADISGDISGLKVNGIEIAPLVMAEVRRRNPELAKMSLKTPKQAKETWAIIERLWASTMRKAKKLPERALHERVDDEWSFVETLRHLVFATDAWVLRAIVGERGHFYPAGMPHDELPAELIEASGLDTKAKPTLQEVMAARKDRQRAVREVIDGLTAAELTRQCRRNPAKAYPRAPQDHDVRTCLAIVCNEEWLHRSFAERDLAVLMTQAAPAKAPYRKAAKKTPTAK